MLASAAWTCCCVCLLMLLKMPLHFVKREVHDPNSGELTTIGLIKWAESLADVSYAEEV